MEGGNPLSGTITIDGAKNALLPILAGCILVSGEVILRTVPKISDIMNMLKILSGIGCVINIQNDTVSINTANITAAEIPKEQAGKIRGSIFIMGALLARNGFVKIPFPGGCAIGSRPIDIHISALQKIGISVKQTKTHIECRQKMRKNKGGTVYLDFPSVGATENVILASVLGSGTYKIINAAVEPEIADLCNFLCACGARISGIGTNEITITAVAVLHGTEYTPIPDRINTGSYLIAVCAAGGKVLLKNAVPQHNANLIDKLKTLGAKIKETPNTIRITYTKPPHPKEHNFNIHTAPYPGFPTDLQSQFAALAATLHGHTAITENLFENRFRYADELRKLGADITAEGSRAKITGGADLRAIDTPHICPVAYAKKQIPACDGTILRAADLRGGVALVIAGLAAYGTTTVTNAEYIYRGHADIVRDLSAVGANIIRIE